MYQPPPAPNISSSSSSPSSSSSSSSSAAIVDSNPIYDGNDDDRSETNSPIKHSKAEKIIGVTCKKLIRK
jgi:hypothetical protein